MTCKNCKTKNEKNATKCVKCGAPMQKKVNNLPIIIAIICLAIVAVGLIVYAFVVANNSDGNLTLTGYVSDTVIDRENVTQTVVSTKTEAPDREIGAYVIKGTIDEDDCVQLESRPFSNSCYVVDINEKYYIPLKNYLTNAEGFSNWMDEEDIGRWTANRRSQYDFGIVYFTVNSEVDLVSTSELFEDGEQIQHTYSGGSVHRGAEGLVEVFAPLECIPDILGYGSVEYDAENEVLKLTKKVEEVEEETREEQLTPEQLEALRAEEERIRAEEERRQQANAQANAREDANVGTPQHEHEYIDNWFEIQERTCTQDGIYIRECVKLCEGGRETITLPAYGHYIDEDGYCWNCGRQF